MIGSLLYLHGKEGGLLPHSRELACDLQLDILFDVMAGGDTFKAETARRIMLDARACTWPEAAYRQAVLRDTVSNAVSCGGMYEALSRSLEAYEQYRQQSKPSFARFSPAATRVRDAAVLCGILLDAAGQVAGELTGAAGCFTSEGFLSFAAAFTAFYDRAFLKAAKAYTDELSALSETNAVRYGVRIGAGFKGTGYVMKTVPKYKRYAAVPLDSVGLQAQATGLMDAGYIKLLRVLNEINAHTLADLRQLRRELAFYLGGVNLLNRLTAIGCPVSYPETPRSPRGFTFTGLMDTALALHDYKTPTANTVELADKTLVVVTGANQGGKSTFLRSIGQALLMARCGLFVTAKQASMRLCGAVFTHFCRGENHAPNSGRLDEELGRIAGIIEQISPDDVLLMNESFSSTSEREGTRMACEILPPLYERGVTVFFVTHLTEYAMELYSEAPENAAFLQAGRNGDGSRNYTLTPGAPQPTGFGLDLYLEMLG